MLEALKRKSLANARHADQARYQKLPHHYSRLREAVSIIVCGLLLAVVMVDSIVGMSGNFGPGRGMVPANRLAVASGSAAR